MTIEINCTTCGTLLRVADEHAGASARCPSCDNVFPIPLDAASATPPAQGFAGEAANPFAGGAAGTPNPYAAGAGSSPFSHPAPGQMQGGTYQKPHRGGLILTLGIVGVVCCLFCGIAAWVMGSADLKEIDAGVMDPEGRGLTQAGMIIGIIGTVLGILGIIVQVVIVGAGAAGGM